MSNVSTNQLSYDLVYSIGLQSIFFIRFSLFHGLFDRQVLCGSRAYVSTQVEEMVNLSKVIGQNVVYFVSRINDVTGNDIHCNATSALDGILHEMFVLNAPLYQQY
jgi:hypothetical protein